MADPQPEPPIPRTMDYSTMRTPPSGEGQLLLGRYEVRRVLGRGAMGEVLEVHDRHSGSDYALKRVPPELVRAPSQMAGIRANFSLIGQLAHPHICTTRQLEVDA